MGVEGYVPRKGLFSDKSEKKTYKSCVVFNFCIFLLPK